MWLITPDAGLLSVVEHREFADVLIVRARRKKDLVTAIKLLPNSKGIKPKRDDNADYRWRVCLSRGDVTALAAALVAKVTYDNVKNEAARKDSALEKCMHSVWWDFLPLDDRPGGNRLARWSHYDDNDPLWKGVVDERTDPLFDAYEPPAEIQKLKRGNPRKSRSKSASKPGKGTRKAKR